MKQILHITSGDIAGAGLAKSGLSGEVFVWHDILYDGPREPGWPDETGLELRARFIEQITGGGLSRDFVLETLKTQYGKLQHAAEYETILWFDACLFDQSMLCHLLACLKHLGVDGVSLICVDAFPGIEPFHGLGQLSPEQLASLFDRRRPVTADQFLFAERVDRAFALQDQVELAALAVCANAPLPSVPAAARRWMKELPDPVTGLSLLQQLALQALEAGCVTPAEVFSYVSAHDEAPQFWGDITLWAKLNELADREPPLMKIEGPEARLPQWEGGAELKLFKLSRG